MTSDSSSVGWAKEHSDASDDKSCWARCALPNLRLKCNLRLPEGFVRSIYKKSR